MTRKITVLMAVACALCLVMPALAEDMKKPDMEMPKMTPEQEAEMQAYMKAGSPSEVHKMLAHSEGTYDCSVKSWHSPGEPMVETGTATRKMVMDGRVLIEDFSSSMMGMPFKGQGMHGYDNVTGKHWSTWIDSMSTGVMLSEGTCDAQGACTFTGTYNDAVKKGPATLRMTSRWTSPRVQVFEMYGPGPDGGETKMMEITYTKK